ncbi:hypothetical protein A3H22_00765 [Candidatus Peribacteria bacterium RIFCSPLOWO2_12_FULL_55_15]|nr:MAG: hypothetical protein A3H22_00765 [Candidatus Peribacteria bacterium RIFCSPLOWO2_12_FULL_55_15]
MPRLRPEARSLIGKDSKVVPMSLQRVAATWKKSETIWIGPEDAVELSKEDREAYEIAHKIMCHLCVQAPTKHQSGHPGGPLSSFTFAYVLGKVRDSHIDQPLRYSAGHLSLLAYGLQWLFGRDGGDPRLRSPQAIIDAFRTPSGLPGHAEAGIGDIPFGAGPLGKGVSNAVGVALGLKYLHSINPYSNSLPSSLRQGYGRQAKGERVPLVDVLMGDGDCQEGQIMEAFRLAARLGLDNLVVHGDFNDVQLSDQPSKTVAADFASMAAATGWRVIEVQNGNDPGQVMAALKKAGGNHHPNLLPSKGEGRPTFICYYTTMGYGVKVMEEGSNTGKENFHGTPLKKEVAEAALRELPPLEELMRRYELYRQREKSRRDGSTTLTTTRRLPFSVKNLKCYSRVVTSEPGAVRKDFGAVHLLNLMKADPRIVVLHADIADSGGFGKVHKEFPDRVINCGVAEANMYMMAAGMRQAGLLPVTYTFAAFGTNEARANARLIDMNSAHVPCCVLHDCTHAGVSVGEDGETHQEQNYLNIPFSNTQVWMPADSNQGAAMAERAMELIAGGHESIYVFSPRSGHPQILRGDGSVFYDKEYVFEGKADVLRGHGDLTDDVTVIATGIMVHAALEAVEREKSIRLLNVSCIRPLDASAIIQAALETAHLIVVEDHNTEGGLASQVADVIADFQLPCSLRRLGLTQYFPSGTDKDLLLMAGLDAESIADAVQDEVATEVRGGENALLVVLHRMSTLLHQSRFGASARLYAEHLQSEKGYLEALREKWKKRWCDPKKASDE